jgi:hypothetical protein
MNGKKIFFSFSLLLLAATILFTSFRAAADKKWEQEYEFLLNGNHVNSYGFSIDVSGRGEAIVTGYAQHVGVILLIIDGDGNEVARGTFPGGSIGCSVDAGLWFHIVTGASSHGLMLLKTYYTDLDFLKDKIYDEPLGIGNEILDTGSYYVVTGVSRPDSSASKDVLILKTNKEGEKQCKNTFGQYTFEDEGFSIDEAHGGGYIIVGRTESYGARETDVYLIKTDENCKEEWYKTLGGESDDCGRSIRRTDDGGYIICGWTHSFGYGAADVYLIKTDSNGNEIWSNVYGGPLEDRGHSVQQTRDGGYIIAGFTSLTSFHTNAYLVKTDKMGKLEWEKIFGGSSSTNGNSVCEKSDGGYLISGTKWNGGVSNVYMVYYYREPAPVTAADALLLLFE